MKIQKMLWQHRRDFRAIFICEHCGHTQEIIGYDDSYYHEKVIPDMECPNCKKKAPDTYEPRATRYSEDEEV